MEVLTPETDHASINGLAHDEPTLQLRESSVLRKVILHLLLLERAHLLLEQGVLKPIQLPLVSHLFLSTELLNSLLVGVHVLLQQLVLVVLGVVHLVTHLLGEQFCFKLLSFGQGRASLVDAVQLALNLCDGPLEFNEIVCLSMLLDSD